jgi:hypothetical protein
MSAIRGTLVAVLHCSRVVAFVTCVIFLVALRYIAVRWRIGSQEAQRFVIRRLSGPDFRTFKSCLREFDTSLL